MASWVFATSTTRIEPSHSGHRMTSTAKTRLRSHAHGCLARRSRSFDRHRSQPRLARAKVARAVGRSPRPVHIGPRAAHRAARRRLDHASVPRGSCCAGAQRAVRRFFSGERTPYHRNSRCKRPDHSAQGRSPPTAQASHRDVRARPRHSKRTFYSARRPVLEGSFKEASVDAGSTRRRPHHTVGHVQGDLLSPAQSKRERLAANVSDNLVAPSRATVFTDARRGVLPFPLLDGHRLPEDLLEERSRVLCVARHSSSEGDLGRCAPRRRVVPGSVAESFGCETDAR